MFASQPHRVAVIDWGGENGRRKRQRRIELGGQASRLQDPNRWSRARRQM